MRRRAAHVPAEPARLRRVEFRPHGVAVASSGSRRVRMWEILFRDLL